MSSEKKYYSNQLEFWGGLECTINRVDNSYFDQLNLSGHYLREEDIQLIASLGIKTLRYPFLWERHEPQFEGTIDWTYSKKIVEKLTSYGITPIAGLLHHGSGPSYTSLLDNKFPGLFASYAARVAQQFPMLQFYTPINEPLTTARFSGLYGHWYPHERNDVSFAKMLLNQVKGVVLAMKEIRKINPTAKLVQTEDLSKTYSPSSLNYQAAFENERRWLTYDLLCGKIKANTPMWNYFVRLGIKEKELEFFLENVTFPDIMGFNYYVTSERYLGQDPESIPGALRGGNEIQEYNDVEAVRINHGNPSGLKILLQEAWDRFRLPMAITEAHLNSGREDQLRWLGEIYTACCDTIESGIDIKALTFWSLFGAYGWNNLVTTKQMEYEPGAFDLRSEKPRPTAIASFIKEIIKERKYTHPLMEQKGWWHQPGRFYKKITSHKPLPSCSSVARPILIIGSTGTLGQAFGKVCCLRNIKYLLTGREKLDITNDKNIEHFLEVHNPWAVINTAGFVRVDEAEDNAAECMEINAKGPILLSKACKKRDIAFVTFSSDLVFDGQRPEPYLETHTVNPLNVYGTSKAIAEKEVLTENPSALVIRTSAFFGPWDHHNFVSGVLRSLSENKKFVAIDDVFISPTYIPHLVATSLDLLIDNESGIWHLANDGTLTWKQFAVKVADKAGYDPGLIIGANIRELNLRADRPGNSVLRSARGRHLPTLDSAIDSYLIQSGNAAKVLLKFL